MGQPKLRKSKGSRLRFQMTVRVIKFYEFKNSLYKKSFSNVWKYDIFMIHFYI